MQRFRWIALQGSSRGLLPPLLLFCFITTSGIPAHAADDPTACRTPVARVVSIQGSIEVLRAPQNDWTKVTRLDTALCEGDRLRTGVMSRAALFIQTETLVRVDQNSSISVSQTAEETLVEFRQEELLPAAASAYTCGAGYFITRFPRKFRVKTPHLNAAVEGTEFLVAMRCESTELSVFEGKVLAAGTADNIFPAQSISSGQVLTIGGTEPPTVKLLVKPTDAVQWVLYYPPLSDATAEADLPSAEQCRSLSKPLDQTCLTQRAEALLRLGRVDEAQREVDEALALDPGSGDANALRAIISIARNNKASAMEAASAATTASPNSSRAWLALSYAQQASFKLEDSLVSALKAQAIEPNSSVTNARVAELLMSIGRIKEAEKAARAAVDANPSESRARTVLGFVRLAQIKTKEARADFLAAIERDSSDPLPRLGLGLAIIRDGKLADGREQLEIAVALDPTNSLLRSYVGKAYYEENSKDRDQLAATQFELAKQLDPNDPTPWFYDAIVKQTQNRPVEALEDLQESIELNNNRAVYRSRLLLDEDHAARGVSLTRTYMDLGFPDLAFKEAAKSLGADPGDSSAHRSLDELYGYTPRREVARDAEDLQAKLRSPITAIPFPVLLRAAGTTPLTVGAVPPGFNEYSRLFDADGLHLQLQGLAGSFDAAGGQAVLSGMSRATSFQFAAYHFETDGIRANNDDRKDLYSGLLQLQVAPSTQLQVEVLSLGRTAGELTQNFYSDETVDLFPLRNQIDLSSVRVGARVEFSERTDLLLSVQGKHRVDEIGLTDDDPFLRITGDSTKYEFQALHRLFQGALIGGASYYEEKADEDFVGFFQTETQPTNAHVYAYAYFPILDSLQAQLGFAYDDLDSRELTTTEFSPKLGLIWSATAETTVRLSAFRLLTPRANDAQGLEPTQVAGFPQLFSDQATSPVSVLAAALDHRFSDRLYAGIGAIDREIEVHLTNPDLTVETHDWQETEGLAYLHWLPARAIALSGTVKLSYYSRPPQFTGVEAFTSLTSLEIPVSLRVFGPQGLSAGLTTTYIRQSGEFESPDPFSPPFTFVEDSESAWLVDANLTFRPPGRKLFFSLDVKNLFDERFRYQDLATADQLLADRQNPAIMTRRAVYARLGLSF